MLLLVIKSVNHCQGAGPMCCRPAGECGLNAEGALKQRSSYTCTESKWWPQVAYFMKGRLWSSSVLDFREPWGWTEVSVSMQIGQGNNKVLTNWLLLTRLEVVHVNISNKAFHSKIIFFLNGYVILCSSYLTLSLLFFSQWLVGYSHTCPAILQIWVPLKKLPIFLHLDRWGDRLGQHCWGAYPKRAESGKNDFSGQLRQQNIYK